MRRILKPYQVYGSLVAYHILPFKTNFFVCVFFFYTVLNLAESYHVSYFISDSVAWVGVGVVCYSQYFCYF